MKKYLIVLVFGLLFFSCEKKEIKNKTVKDVNSILKDSIKEAVIETKKISELIFTVQVAALLNKNSSFNKIENIKIYNEGNLIKYRFGAFTTYNEAKEFRKSILTNYPDAFVQAIKNGEPIKINEAL
ncbi:hypothetical protein BTO04_06250 [Polaribacter sp. SA4-10]|uniref:SPOR domain-containing protein n=1 Tax=Polaribacter sp. SA4-10 TaxID=754397 RepID=UPI000B3C7BDC|nr:SPOR domain-containing protein [Polaribacter sp. SA4-10]ARV06325.1 hypothetical protein BTO04_06250 [Polaribacter sp. SA4-10]